MYKRIFSPPKNSSYFLFGPRGTGKSSFVQSMYETATFVDLLEDRIYRTLLVDPQRHTDYLPTVSVKNPTSPQIIVIDEVQKVPALLDEVHRLIEKKKYLFVLTGSSARKLKRTGTNLLAGRALTCSFCPLTRAELGEDFNLQRALKFGLLPMSVTASNPKEFLESYKNSYLN